ncbi:MAG: LacI family DNA-binding transcriptional regulator [Alphaproteobacteria bacterium]|nr:LacI family DNA-binding transcriptional regulator [Alphaproteobacteria bacterium]
MSSDTKRTTIYDIAALAQASPSAVSAVLNGSWKKRRLSKAMADRVLRIAEQEGYAVNVQASLLRRDRSHIVGMIVPKYDNRYFGHIAEQFEAMARCRDLFPFVTCTQRDSDLEFEAAKELVSYQAECVISTGATDPDRISAFCKASGVQSINLDLPGTLAPSVISDNFTAARDLTNLILDRCDRDLGWKGPLHFVGGRREDHNTSARIEGFEAAHADRGIAITDAHIMAYGYSAKAARSALDHVRPHAPTGIFVNSTISLEGVVQWYSDLEGPQKWVRYGCFDYDPFGSFLPGNVGMIEQNVDEMLRSAFEWVGKPTEATERILVPCSLRTF